MHFAVGLLLSMCGTGKKRYSNNKSVFNLFSPCFLGAFSALCRLWTFGMFQAKPKLWRKYRINLKKDDAADRRRAEIP